MFKYVRRLTLTLLLTAVHMACVAVSRRQLPVQNSPPDFQKIFARALEAVRPNVLYRIRELVSKNGLPAYEASFDVAGHDSVQVVSLVIDSQFQCSMDTRGENMNLVPGGVGPNGASFELRFCASHHSLTLADFNRLSGDDAAHGVSLVSLAEQIQIALRFEQ